MRADGRVQRGESERVRLTDNGESRENSVSAAICPVIRFRGPWPVANAVAVSWKQWTCAVQPAKATSEKRRKIHKNTTTTTTTIDDKVYIQYTKYLCVCVCFYCVFSYNNHHHDNILDSLKNVTLCENYFFPHLIESFPIRTAALPVMAAFFYFISILASVRAITIYVCIHSPIYMHTYTRYRLISIGIWEKRARQVLYRFVSWYFWDIREQLFGQNKKHLWIHTYICIIFVRLFMMAI